MMKYNLIFRVFMSLCLMTIFSCSDFIKKEIEIKSTDSASKLVVFSGLENDLFYVYLGLSTPIIKSDNKLSVVVKDAIVRLYEENRLMLEITRRDDHPDDPYYNPDDPFLQYVQPYATRQDIKIIPGKSYRLEVTFGNYPPVTSTVVAPEEPQIDNVFLLTFPVIKKDYSRIVYPDKTQGHFYDGCGAFYQMNFTLKDNPATKDYYLIEAFYSAIDDHTVSGLYTTQRQIVASSDRILMQDNPDVVANQWMNDPEKNTFAFSQMILTDLSFQGKSQNLNILLSNCNLQEKDGDCDRLRKIYGDSRVYNVHYRLVGVVKHICKEAYDYYRSIALQGDASELAFFSEPVSIISNINGGYGCFSVSSTKQLVLSEYDVCYVPYY